MTYRVPEGAEVSLGIDGKIIGPADLTEDQVTRFGPEGLASLVAGGALVEVPEPKARAAKAQAEPTT